ncbi:MAG: hypothetical protein DWP95_10570, partial [Proteobacteria bacterium]
MLPTDCGNHGGVLLLPTFFLLFGLLFGNAIGGYRRATDDIRRPAFFVQITTTDLIIGGQI